MGGWISWREPPIVTATVGARCSDGIVIVADKLVTDEKHELKEYHDKLSYDIAHVITAYAGSENLFKAFREQLTYDVNRSQGISEQYTYDNAVPKLATMITKLHKQLGDGRYTTEVLVGIHPKMELGWIDSEGHYSQAVYVARGSGKEIVNEFCGSLNYPQLKMKDFAKLAYAAIMYIERYIPQLYVGVGPEQPTVHYLPYDSEWDKAAPNSDMDFFRRHTNEKLKEHDARLRDFINSL